MVVGDRAAQHYSKLKELPFEILTQLIGLHCSLRSTRDSALGGFRTLGRVCSAISEWIPVLHAFAKSVRLV